MNMNAGLETNRPQKIAAITGASRGIGMAVAKALESSVDRLVLIASSAESFEHVRQEFSDKADFHWADFASTSDLRRLALELQDKYDHIDALVNNCGVYAEGPLADADPDQLERLLDINIKAPILLTRYLLDHLKKGTNSIVINLSSIQAINKDASLSTYAASKAGLSAFSEALRKELNPFGVRVTCLEPSGVNTWGEANPIGLLAPSDVADIIASVLAMHPTVQVNTIVLSGL